MNFNYNFEEGLRIFRPTERTSIETLWGVKLPEIQPFFTSDDARPPADIDPKFMNMDFEFTDVN